jgi:hypothetical protein
MHSFMTSLLVCLLSPAEVEVFQDSDLGFSVPIPAGCVRNAEIERTSPKIICAYLEPNPDGGIFRRLFAVERMNGTIGREKLDPKDLPKGSEASIFTEKWRSYEVEAFRLVETAGDTQLLTLNVQIPLKRRAIQLKLAGPLSDETELRSQLGTILGGLQGESNWDGPIPGNSLGVDQFGYVLLAGGIAFIVVGLIALWIVSRYSPRGVVLVIAICIWAASWVPAESRVMKMTTGSTRMLGFAGGILGFIDLLRKRSNPLQRAIPAQIVPQVPDEKPNSNII